MYLHFVWSRFGPGLVIYWFDFVDSLPLDADILVMNHMPTTFQDLTTAHATPLMTPSVIGSTNGAERPREVALLASAAV
jgi:hypothetical protein